MPIKIGVKIGQKRETSAFCVAEVALTRSSWGRLMSSHDFRRCYRKDAFISPEAAEAEALAQELLDYEVKIEPDANDRYGAFRVGTHDDQVTALGLAVQCDPKKPFVPRIF